MSGRSSRQWAVHGLVLTRFAYPRGVKKAMVYIMRNPRVRVPNPNDDWALIGLVTPLLGRPR